jgi:hypothetical protein
MCELAALTGRANKAIASSGSAQKMANNSDATN